MSTDRTPEDSDAETEAVLSLQETPTADDGAEVEAHGASLYSTWSIACVVKPPVTTVS
ncbi:hypothetical protein [Kitasatospora sp. CB01950]|uniref:hypothetical protein n=1 Tax=Kitasatospora sp. CB01950 TaxID=1703930 RepID=UPI0013018D3B|nr:hypothetical protein [Kitasatospora sp. CB01950]